MATKQELQESYESLSGAVERACFEMDRLREVNRELLTELEECRKELLGSSAYLSTCDPVTIVQNLDSFIASLTRRLTAAAAAIRKAKGE